MVVVVVVVVVVSMKPKVRKIGNEYSSDIVWECFVIGEREA